MKTAKTSPAAVYVDCPECGENIEHPATGSYLWEVNSPVRQTTVQCTSCRCTVKVPKKLVAPEGN